MHSFPQISNLMLICQERTVLHVTVLRPYQRTSTLHSLLKTALHSISPYRAASSASVRSVVTRLFAKRSSTLWNWTWRKVRLLEEAWWSTTIPSSILAPSESDLLLRLTYRLRAILPTLTAAAVTVETTLVGRRISHPQLQLSLWEPTLRLLRFWWGWHSHWQRFVFVLFIVLASN